MLDKDHDALAQYLNWKSTHKVVVDVVKQHSLALCNLCQKLHDPLMGPKSYHDLESWWVKSSQCQPKGSFPWSFSGKQITP